MASLTDIKGIGPAKAETLEEEGFESVEAVAEAEREALASISGVGEERALEYIVEAERLIEDEAEEEESSGEEFDLTPKEVSEELEEEVEDEQSTEEEAEEIVEEVEEEMDDAVVDEDEESSDEDSYTVSIEFDTQLEYDVFHAALMRYHEGIYTSHQSTSDTMQKLLDGLVDFDEVEYELTRDELNTLHTAVKQVRTDYQGNNLIDHMDALIKIENQINDQRREHLF